jgi:outer membrane lipoprotein-sorting protein
MRKALLLLSAILMLTVAGSAQTVDEIIAKNAAAKGGLAKLKAVQSTRFSGTIDFGGVQAEITRVVKRPNKTRMEITTQGMTMVQAYDGQNGWQIVPFTGKKDPEPMAADELKSAAQQADIDGPLVDYKKKGHKVELIGKEKIEGTDAYHLRITMKDGDIRDLYLDADSFLEIKMIAKTTRRGAEMVIQTTVGDYKEVNGLMMPFSIEIKVQGMDVPGQKVTISKIEFNMPVDDARFKMPAVAAAPAEKAAPAGANGKKSDGPAKPPQK